MNLTREIPVDPARTALLFIDVQNFAAHREGAEFADLSAEDFRPRNTAGTSNSSRPG